MFAALPRLSSRSCDAMAAAFQHSGAWTAPICNPSALHPRGAPCSTASALHPPPPRTHSAWAPLHHLHHHHHALHHHRRRNYSQHNCVLSLSESPRSAGWREEPKFSGMGRKVQVEAPLKTKRNARWREKGSEDGRERDPGPGDRWGTCQTPAVSQLPRNRLRTV